MIFTPTSIDGVTVIGLVRYEDERGSFARTFCTEEFSAHGLELSVVQCSISFNPVAGTLRGLHFQAGGGPEAKLVRCSRGGIFDVAVDLRPSSRTYCRWTGTELNAEAGNALFVPAGCAHGFLTTEPSTEVTYSIGTLYAPELSRGVRWNDPVFGVEWPYQPTLISDRDATYPDFRP